MAKYSVKQLSELAGVSIRTLHHYDEIGLLKPAERAESRYRYYGRAELYRLQQILFYRELDYPLADIKQILDNPEFDLKSSLLSHKVSLINRVKKVKQLLDTIDKTIVQLENESTMITDEEMYQGFSKEEVTSMKTEVMEAWGEDEVKNTEQNVQNLGKDEWRKVQAEADRICVRLSKMMDRSPMDAEVQKEVVNYHQYLCTFYQVSNERYRALGEMYEQDERFTAHYDKFKPGLAVFLNKAIQVFCDNNIKVMDS